MYYFQTRLETVQTAKKKKQFKFRVENTERGRGGGGIAAGGSSSQWYRRRYQLLPKDQQQVPLNP